MNPGTTRRGAIATMAAAATVAATPASALAISGLPFATPEMMTPAGITQRFQDERLGRVYLAWLVQEMIFVGAALGTMPDGQIFPPGLCRRVKMIEASPYSPDQRAKVCLVIGGNEWERLAGGAS